MRTLNYCRARIASLPWEEHSLVGVSTFSLFFLFACSACTRSILWENKSTFFVYVSFPSTIFLPFCIFWFCWPGRFQKSSNKLYRYITGLRRRSCTAVAKPSIPPHSVFLGQRESFYNFILISYMDTWSTCTTPVPLAVRRGGFLVCAILAGAYVASAFGYLPPQ